MNKIKNTENQTKNLYLKIIVDIGVTALISLSFLYFYEMYWLSEHTAKENLLAIHFDMFSMVYSLVALLFMFFLPKAFENISSRGILRRYTSEKQIPTKVVRFLKIIPLLMMSCLNLDTLSLMKKAIDYIVLFPKINFTISQILIKETNI